MQQLVASSLYLLHSFISLNSQDLVQVLLVHPRVYAFIDAAFGAVHNAVRSLNKKLLVQGTDLPKRLGARSAGAVSAHCQQAEAALQFLHSLCQHKLFKDRVAKNKELCENSGVLMLAQSVLSLAIAPEFAGEVVIIASVSRMKAKVLSTQTLLPCRSYTLAAERGNGVWRNLCSLLLHAQSLLPNFLTSEDLVILRVFSDQYKELLNAEDKQQRKKPLNLNNEEALEIGLVISKSGT